MRLVDFQILVANSAGQGPDGQRRANIELFATFEQVRLWLKERRLQAPFRKIVITLADPSSRLGADGPITGGVALNMYLAQELIPFSDVRDHTKSVAWVVQRILGALAHVQLTHGWRSAELEAFVVELGTRPWPLLHLFEALSCTERKTGTVCTPWFATTPESTKVGVRIGSEDTVVREANGSLYLEDDFPFKKTAIRNGEFVFLDRAGTVLASVPLPNAG